MKTLNAWQNSKVSFTKFVKTDEEIDKAMYWHFLCTVPPTQQYHNGFLMGEAVTVDKEGNILYLHFIIENGKYYYKGLKQKD